MSSVPRRGPDVAGERPVAGAKAGGAIAVPRGPFELAEKADRPGAIVARQERLLEDVDGGGAFALADPRARQQVKDRVVVRRPGARLLDRGARLGQPAGVEGGRRGVEGGLGARRRIG